MERQLSDRRDPRNDALRLKLAIGGLLLCVLIYGCWQAAGGADTFPKDFR